MSARTTKPEPQGYEFQYHPGSHYRIPIDTGNALCRWVEAGQLPGGFLQAVIANDLKGAYSTADVHNFPNIPAIIHWLWNHAPRDCWGSPEALRTWKGMH